jgi:hypothetical protein
MMSIDTSTSLLDGNPGNSYRKTFENSFTIGISFNSSSLFPESKTWVAHPFFNIFYVVMIEIKQFDTTFISSLETTHTPFKARKVINLVK